jgi:Flp pilus assembly protein CpaB
MRRGEPLTDVRLLGPALVQALAVPGLVAVPLRVADGAAAAALAHPGDVVDVLATSDTGDSTDAASRSSSRLVAAAVRVLTVTTAGELGGGGDGPGLVVVAGTRDQAGALAAAATERLSLLLRHP